MISVSIDRTSLALGALVLSDDYTASLWVSVVEPPAFAYRYTYAAPAPDLSGQLLLTAALDQGALGLVVYAQAGSTAALEAAKASLDQALGQFSYQVTLTVDGVGYPTWYADPTRPVWGLSHGMIAAGMSRGAVSIPVNPT